MTVCLRGQGYGSLAERRDQGRTTGLEGLRPLRADRKTASRHSLPAPASRYAGGNLGAGALSAFAGETFAYALAGARAGKECRRRLPSSWPPSNGVTMGLGESFLLQVRKSDQET